MGILISNPKKIIYSHQVFNNHTISGYMYDFHSSVILIYYKLF